jgi:IS30 family transposase
MKHYLTEEQRNQIKVLGKSGLTYAKIANKLGLSIGRVHYTCSLETRKASRKRALARYYAHKKEYKLYSTNWRKKNRGRYNHAVALSWVRYIIRSGVLTKAEVLNAMENSNIRTGRKGNW